MQPVVAILQVVDRNFLSDGDRWFATYYAISLDDLIWISANSASADSYAPYVWTQVDTAIVLPPTG